MTDETERFRRLNGRLAVVATLAIAAIGGVMAITLVVVARWRFSHPETLTRLLLTWSPSAFYLWALWTLRGLFAGLSRSGPSAQPSITRALARIGWALMGGAVTTLVTAPVVLAMENPHRAGGFAVFNVPALTLGLLGLALIIVARMLKQAIAAEARVKSLENVLEGFV
jgi:hypothetical protein